MNIGPIRKRIRAHRNDARAEVCRKYFKTGKGEYGEGDRFLGLDVPTMRALAKELGATPLDVVEELLHSPWHEERVVALLILVRQFERGGDRDAILALYLANTRFINNWDLVDCSAPYIAGVHGTLKLWRRLAKSPSLWERRIAIMSTFHRIRANDFAPALAIAKLLVHDPEDLIHKAVGWMLREIGKRDLAAEKRFLDEHAATMPRTMLRYAIEKFPEVERKRYLAR